MKMTRLRGALLAAAALMLIAGNGSATAAKPVKAKLTLEKLTKKGASGKISSKSSKCERGRKVTLRFVGQYGDVKLASDKTDRRGRWKVNVKIADRGIFYATAPKATKGKTKCAAAASKDRRLR